MTSFFEALILGVLYGLGPCAIVCAPILVPLIMATAKTGKEGIIQVFSFNFGKISAYIFLGGFFGYTGYFLSDLVSEEMAGIFLIFLGIFILLQYFFNFHYSNSNSCSFLKKIGGRKLSFITGLVIAFRLCPALLAVLSLAALERSPLIGAGMGLAFGIGCLVTPLIIFGFLAGKLATLNELKNIAPIVSCVFLIILGLIKTF